MARTFTEDSRVKAPAILHLVELGYDWLSKAHCSANCDNRTNIDRVVFTEQFCKLNPNATEKDAARMIEEIATVLENDDLGQQFYEKMLRSSEAGKRLIDFNVPKNNAFHVSTELTYGSIEDDNFRPDITIFVNGLPLAFCEVKIPNNAAGMLAERDRMNVRLKNRAFKRYMNLTQLMVFSNNQPYDDSAYNAHTGSFYATNARKIDRFHFFREEQDGNLIGCVRTVTEELLCEILRESNALPARRTPEFITNYNPQGHLQRFLTSLFYKERFLFMLQYGLAYVRFSPEDGGAPRLEKHIIRYPQFFAMQNMVKTLDAGKKKGIIWHTQGSGKTALAYFSHARLTNYYAKRNIIAKFYFIVDRIDLAEQAERELSARGLRIHLVSTRDKFAESLQSQAPQHNPEGEPEITIVNIQKFSDDARTITSPFQTKLQRIFFIDEAHRSYNPSGSFLSSLLQADSTGIYFALTGTPLLGNRAQEQFGSRGVWGDYLHTYFYNQSIKDGFTVRLVREEIETRFHNTMQEALSQIRLIKGDISKEKIYFAHENFVSPMLEYIISDFLNAQLIHGDPSIGGMIVCHSSEQARKMKETFDAHYLQDGLTAALILHDEGTKAERRALIKQFKDGEISFLFVYNMLLTGFDAPRLKKLYVGRNVREHSLLQMLARANRPYGNFKYGFVVDFADISADYDRVNQAYLTELQDQLGEDWDKYNALFKTREEVEEQVAEMRSVLWRYDTNNKEEFDRQVSACDDLTELVRLRRAMQAVRDLRGVILHCGYDDILNRVQLCDLADRINSITRAITMKHELERIELGDATPALLQIALGAWDFAFTKLSEHELRVADEIMDSLRKAGAGLSSNFDPKDPEWTTLSEELLRIYTVQKNFKNASYEEMAAISDSVHSIMESARRLNYENALIRAKFNHDEKYARLYKRLLEQHNLSPYQQALCVALCEMKQNTDTRLLNQSGLLNNAPFLEQELKVSALNSLDYAHIPAVSQETIEFIASFLVTAYTDEFTAQAS